MEIFSKLFGLFNSKKNNSFEGTINTTLVGLEVSNQTKSQKYNIATLHDYLKDNPTSSFARYMLAEVLLDKNDIVNARKEFMIALKLEKKYKEQILTQEEKKLKKAAKAKIEKRLGYKIN
jgi:hypothetical protein